MRKKGQSSVKFAGKSAFPPDEIMISLFGIASQTLRCTSRVAMTRPTRTRRGRVAALGISFRAAMPIIPGRSQCGSILGTSSVLSRPELVSGKLAEHFKSNTLIACGAAAASTGISGKLTFGEDNFCGLRVSLFTSA
jgi:hypothetical protein